MRSSFQQGTGPKTMSAEKSKGSMPNVSLKDEQRGSIEQHLSTMAEVGPKEYDRSVCNSAFFFIEFVKVILTTIISAIERVACKICEEVTYANKRMFERGSADEDMGGKDTCVGILTLHDKKLKELFLNFHTSISSISEHKYGRTVYSDLCDGIQRYMKTISNTLTNIVKTYSSFSDTIEEKVIRMDNFTLWIIKNPVTAKLAKKEVKAFNYFTTCLMNHKKCPFHIPYCALVEMHGVTYFLQEWVHGEIVEQPDSWKYFYDKYSPGGAPRETKPVFIDSEGYIYAYEVHHYFSSLPVRQEYVLGLPMRQNAKSLRAKFLTEPSILDVTINTFAKDLLKLDCTVFKQDFMFWMHLYGLRTRSLGPVLHNVDKLNLCSPWGNVVKQEILFRSIKTVIRHIVAEIKPGDADAYKDVLCQIFNCLFCVQDTNRITSTSESNLASQRLWAFVEKVAETKYHLNPKVWKIEPKFLETTVSRLPLTVDIQIRLHSVFGMKLSDQFIERLKLMEKPYAEGSLYSPQVFVEVSPVPKSMCLMDYAQGMSEKNQARKAAYLGQGMSDALARMACKSFHAAMTAEPCNPVVLAEYAFGHIKSWYEQQRVTIKHNMGMCLRHIFNRALIFSGGQNAEILHQAAVYFTLADDRVTAARLLNRGIQVDKTHIGCNILLADILANESNPEAWETAATLYQKMCDLIIHEDKLGQLDERLCVNYAALLMKQGKIVEATDYLHRAVLEKYVPKDTGMEDDGKSPTTNDVIIEYPRGSGNQWRVKKSYPRDDVFVNAACIANAFDFDYYANGLKDLSKKFQ